MLKIIHGADFHLDSPFSGLFPQQAAQRRQEQRDLIGDLCQLVEAREADLLLLSGDLFDGQEIYRDTVEALADSLSQLSCPVFIAPGNHDFYHIRSPYATANWGANVHIFSTESVEAVELPQKNAVVYGAAFLSPHMTRSPLEGFSAPSEDGKIHLMTLHGALDGTDYAPISQEIIAQSNLDYLALGHVHQFGGLQQSGNTHYAYSGCPQGRGFDELGEKGVLCVTLDGADCTAEFIPLCHRRYQITTLDVTDVDNIAQTIQGALPEDSQLDSHRFLLTGTAHQVDVKALTAQLEGSCFSLDIRDHTRPPMDIWAGKGEDNLRGLFLAEMSARGGESDPNLQLALKYGLAALEQREDVSP